MGLLKANWNPTDRQLRQFGLILAVGLPSAGWLLTSRAGFESWSIGGELWISRRGLVAMLACLGAGCGLCGWLRPTALRSVYLALTAITLPLGLVLGEVITMIVFFGVFTPLGLVFRLIRRDPLQRQIRRDSDTYWQYKACTNDPQRYLRQF